MAMESEFLLGQMLDSPHDSLQVRSINPHTIARRIGTEGKNCKIHPTAVIEACEIGDNAIGPYAVVRASIIGDGAVIEEHAAADLSVLGPDSTCRLGMR